MKLKDKAKPRESFLTLLIFVLLLFTFFNNFYAPRGKALRDLGEKISAAKQEKKILELGLTILAKKGTPRPQTPAGATSGDPKMDILNGSGKGLARFSDFIRTLTEPHFEPGIKVDSFTFAAEEKRSGFSRISFKLTAKGAFNHITPFIEKIDSLPALVAIDSLFLGNDEEAQGMDIEIGASFYQTEGGNYEK